VDAVVNQHPRTAGRVGSDRRELAELNRQEWPRLLGQAERFAQRGMRVVRPGTRPDDVEALRQARDNAWRGRRYLNMTSPSVAVRVHRNLGHWHHRVFEDRHAVDLKGRDRAHVSFFAQRHLT
jgi:hypothetical protein